MKLSGNTILITGGTSGIGLALAKEFTALGNKVIVCGRRVDRLEQMKLEIPGLVAYRCDVSVAAERRALLEWLQSEHPDANVLVNNAGVQLTADLHHEIDLDRLETEMNTNFTAPVHLSSLFAAFLKGKEGAAIVNISSGLAFVPIAFMPIYCASKAAIHSFTLSLRYQLRNSGIQVFEIAPPAVDTELGHDRRTDKNQSHGGIPVGEFVQGAMEALENDVLEATVGMATSLRQNREGAFEMLNSRFQ